MANANFKNEKRGGFYFKGGKPYISVTKILGVIDKPQLRYWFGREVYRAMVIDPTLDEQTALASPYKISEKAKNRGSAVHSIVESWKVTGEVTGIDGVYAGYANAFKTWLSDHKVDVTLNEQTVFSDKHGYAGTLDMIADVNGHTMLIDVKTGADLYPEVHLQLSAYREALKESGSEVFGTGALLLNEDGTYKYEIGKDKFNAFLACKTIYEGLNEEYLEKIRNK